jgi:hypothetical protein
MELLVLAAIIVAFEYAAARWACDSRDGFTSPTR